MYCSKDPLKESRGCFFSFLQEVGKEDKVRAELGGALRGVLTGKRRVGLLTGQRMAL